MKRSPYRSWFVALLLLATAFTRVEAVSLDATLVLASREPLPADARLERIEPKLRKVFNFESFQQIGEGSVTMSLPGKATLPLGHGYRLAISAEKPKDGKSRALVSWFRGDKLLMETSVRMGKGRPAVLGGPPHEGGNLILVLRAKKNDEPGTMN